MVVSVLRVIIATDKLRIHFHVKIELFVLVCWEAVLLIVVHVRLVIFATSETQFHNPAIQVTIVQKLRMRLPVHLRHTTTEQLEVLWRNVCHVQQAIFAILQPYQTIICILALKVPIVSLEVMDLYYVQMVRSVLQHQGHWQSVVNALLVTTVQALL